MFRPSIRLDAGSVEPPRARGLLVAFIGAMLLISAMPVSAQEISVQGADSSKHAGELIVPASKSQMLELDVAFKEAFVGNPEIADVMPLSNRTLYVLGKQFGSTSLTIYGANRKLIAVMDLVVTPDIDGLKQRLHEIMPHDEIAIRPANGSLMLSGTVSSPAKLSSVLAVAETFAPERIINLLSVGSPQQVMLEVRFSEVQRSTAKTLGFNFDLRDNGGDFIFSSGDSFLNNGIREGVFGFSATTLHPGAMTLDALFDALEEKGLVTTLAEPNLVALSGDTASFLAGGEFPIPVAQASGGSGNNVAITIVFKQFGVSLAFTPTVLDDGLINLEVVPEVSTIDPGTSVSLQGFNIPGLQTRRASTTIELRDGESFAIAGLIQSDFADTVRQFPVLSEVPILGTLLRSSNFQRNETELVITVTPRLVAPVKAGSLALPTDNILPPSEFEFFFMGRRAGHGTPTKSEEAQMLLERQNAGGIDGPYGHILR